MRYIYLIAFMIIITSLSAQVDWIYTDDSGSPDDFKSFTHGAVVGDTIIAAAFNETDFGFESSIYTISTAGQFISEEIEDGAGAILYMDVLNDDTLGILRILIDDEEPTQLQWGTMVGTDYTPVPGLEIDIDGLEGIKLGSSGASEYYISFGTFVDQDYLDIVMRVDFELGTMAVDTTTTFITSLTQLPDTAGYLAITYDSLLFVDNDLNIIESREFDWSVAGVAAAGDSLLIFSRSLDEVNSLIYADGNLTTATTLAMPFAEVRDESLSSFLSCDDRYWLVSVLQTSMPAITRDEISLIQFDDNLDTVAVVGIAVPEDEEILLYNPSCVDDDILLFGDLYTDAKGVAIPWLARVSSDLMVSTSPTIVKDNLIDIASNDIDGRLHIDNRNNEAVDVVIYDVNGRQVARYNAVTGQAVVDVSKLVTGQYYAQAMRSATWMTTKAWFKQ